MMNIYLVGGGGHCKSVIDVIELTGGFNISGIVEQPGNASGDVCGFEINASDDDLDSLVSKGFCFHVTVGHIESPALRVRLYSELKNRGARVPCIVSSRAHVSKFSKVGDGTIVMHDTVVNAHAEIGENSIINNKALVEHDAKIGSHTHVSTGAIVNGGCQVGAEVFVGSGSILVQGVSVADGTVIGAGTVVHQDITVPGVYVGNPCRRIR